MSPLVYSQLHSLTRFPSGPPTRQCEQSLTRQAGRKPEARERNGRKKCDSTVTALVELLRVLLPIRSQLTGSGKISSTWTGPSQTKDSPRMPTVDFLGQARAVRPGRLRPSLGRANPQPFLNGQGRGFSSSSHTQLHLGLGWPCVFCSGSWHEKSWAGELVLP